MTAVLINDLGYIMNNLNDEARLISNPRLLSGVYFALLAIIATIAIDTALYLLGVSQFIPIFWAILLGVGIAGGFGALFGVKIIRCPTPYRRKTFLLGFIMVIAALPFYDLGFLYIMKDYAGNAVSNAEPARMAVMYGFVLFYSFIIVGWWLAILGGFAAMYLRGRLVYDIMHTDDGNNKTNEQNAIGTNKKQSD